MRGSGGKRDPDGGGNRRRAGRATRPLLACWMLASALALAGMRPSEAIAGDGDAARFEALVASALSMARAAASDTDGRTTGTLMFYDPSGDVAGGVDGAPYGTGDRAWVEATLGVYDLYRQIGGEAGDRRYLFRREGERVFVGIEGGSGAWHPSIEDGQAAFLRLLVRSSRTLSESLRLAVLGGDASRLDLLARRVAAELDDPRKVLLVPRDGSRTVRIEDAWHAVGTSGLDVRAVPEAGGVTASVRRRSGKTDGPQAVLAFSNGHRFSPSETIEVAAGDAGAPTDARMPQEEPAKPPIQDRLDPRSPSPVAGVISTGGETRRYTISVPATGGYAIRSTGPSDLVGVLKGPDGTVVARDDDGGAGYNFRLEATLQAGDYTLEVVHCCAGTGPFSLIVTAR